MRIPSLPRAAALLVAALLAPAALAGEAAEPTEDGEAKAAAGPADGEPPAKPEGLPPLGRPNPYQGTIAAEIKGTGDGATEDPVTHTPYQGYGELTRGGFGGRTVEVTNLNDSGAGSFRAACQSGGGAVIVFKVGGTIFPKSGIDLSGKGVTVAGETAPAPGITLDGRALADPMGYILGIKGSDVILRHIRARNSAAENIEILSGKRILIDHVSSTYCGDGAIDVDQGGFITVSWSLIGGAVEASRAHGFKSSWHHNLFANSNRRHPKIMGKDAKPFDYRNNVLIEWMNYGVRTEMGAGGNIVCNWIGISPNKDREPRHALDIGHSASEWYIAGNHIDGFDIDTLSRLEKPYEEPGVTTLAPEEARRLVLEKAGAHPRDEIDAAYFQGKGPPRPEKLIMPLPPEAGGAGGGGEEGKAGPPKDPKEALREAQQRVDELKKAANGATGAERKKAQDAYLKALKEMRDLQKGK